MLGIGIEYDYEDDEIEGDYERLTIAFSETVVLSEVYVTDLFNEWGYLETGWYELDNSQTPVWFSASLAQEIGSTNGELTLNIGQSVDSITFGAPGLIGCQNHDFSVAGVNVTPVPEPATLLLLGSGLLGAGLFRRRISKRS